MQTVCAACGGPRLPGGVGGEAAATALREQKKFHGAARLASVATVVQAIVAVVVALIGLTVMPASIVAQILLLAFTIVPLLLALRSRSRAKKARTAAGEASERAWQAGAEAVAARSKGGVSVPVLAKTLGIEPAQADKLLTSLAVHDRTRIDVSDDAVVVYSAGPEALARAREEDALSQAAHAEAAETEAATAEHEGRAR